MMVKKNQIENHRVTLADVAEAAGVSMMTVSRVVNNKPGVGDETRQMIASLIDEMGYIPNSLARGLVTQKTKAIGLIVPDNTNPFFAQIARGVEDEAFEQGYSIFLMNTGENPAREEQAFETLLQKNIDGLISCSSRLPNQKLQNYIKKFSSVVLLNRVCKANLSNVTQINVDDELGAKMVVNYLIEKKRQHIVHISGPKDSFSASRRQNGFLIALKDAGIAYEVPSDYIIRSSPTYEGGRAAMEKILHTNPRVDAIYAFNDMVAVGAIQVCQEHGKKIPGDIAIVGVDGAAIGTIINPKLTTLKIELTEVGKLIMQTLLNNINNENMATSVLLRPELVIRESA